MPEVLEETNQSQREVKDNAELSSLDLGNDSESLSSIHFKLTVFEGPLDLLLHLIKDSKLDIYDIPIVEITHQYMEYIGFMKELNLEIAGEFLVMAATLIHIKSKMLLPPEEEEKEEPAEDPRAELVKRLLEYQAFKESSVHLRKREEVWKNIYYRNTPENVDIVSEPEPVLFEASAYDLMTAFKKLLEKAPPQSIEITRETLTVADRINFIMERLEKKDGIKFEELFEEGCTRIMLIVTFLALLEVIRLGLVRIYQEKVFGSIWILNPQKEAAGPSAEESPDVVA